MLESHLSEVLFCRGIAFDSRSATSLHHKLPPGQPPSFCRHANEHSPRLKSQNKQPNRSCALALSADSPALVQTRRTRRCQRDPGTEVSNLLFIIAHSIFKSLLLSLTVTELFQKHEPIKHLPQPALNNSLER